MLESFCTTLLASELDVDDVDGTAADELAEEAGKSDAGDGNVDVADDGADDGADTSADESGDGVGDTEASGAETSPPAVAKHKGFNSCAVVQSLVSELRESFAAASNVNSEYPAAFAAGVCAYILGARNTAPAGSAPVNARARSLVSTILLDFAMLNVFAQPSMAPFPPGKTLEHTLLPWVDFAGAAAAADAAASVTSALNACIGAVIAADRDSALGDDAGAMLEKLFALSSKPESVAIMALLAAQLGTDAAKPVLEKHQALVNTTLNAALTAAADAMASLEDQAKAGGTPMLHNELRLVSAVFSGGADAPMASDVGAPVLTMLTDALAACVGIYRKHAQCPPEPLLDAIVSVVSSILAPSAAATAIEHDDAAVAAARKAMAGLFDAGTLVDAARAAAMNPALESWIRIVSSNVAGNGSNKLGAANQLQQAMASVRAAIYYPLADQNDGVEALSKRPQYSSIITSCAKAAATLSELAAEVLDQEEAAAVMRSFLPSVGEVAALRDAVHPSPAGLLPHFVTQKLSPCLIPPAVAFQQDASDTAAAAFSGNTTAVGAWIAHVSFATQACGRVASLAGSEVQVCVYHDHQWTLAHAATLRQQAQGCGFWVIDELETCQQQQHSGSAADGGSDDEDGGLGSVSAPSVDVVSRCMSRLVDGADNGPGGINAASLNTLLAMLSAAVHPAHPASSTLAGSSTFLASLLTGTTTKLVEGNEAGGAGAAAAAAGTFVGPGTALALDAVITAIPEVSAPLLKLLRALSAACTASIASRGPTKGGNGPAALVLLVACIRRLLRPRTLSGDGAAVGGNSGGSGAEAAAPISRLVKESMAQQGNKDVTTAIALMEDVFENQLSEVDGLFAPVEVEDDNDDDDDDDGDDGDGIINADNAGGEGAPTAATPSAPDPSLLLPWWVPASSPADSEAGAAEDEDDEATPAQLLAVSVAAAQFFSMLPEKCGLDLSSSQWDFLLCTTVGWLETDSSHWAGASLLVASIDVLIATHNFFADLAARTAGGSAPTNSEVAAAAGREWADFFVPAAAEFLISAMEKTPCPIPKTEAEEAAKRSVDLAVCRAVVLVPGASLLEHAKLSVLYSRLASSDRQVQFAAYFALSKMVAAEPLVMARQVKVDTPLAAAVVESIQMATQLRAMQAGGEGGLAATSASSTSRWLLLAGLVFCRLFRAAADQSRAALVALLKPNKCLDNMLVCASGRLSALSAADIKASLVAKEEDFLAFQQSSRQSNTGWKTVSPEVFENMLACRLFECSLRSIPAVARNWFEDLGSRSAGADIAKFTTKHLSPRLIELELGVVGKRAAVVNEDSDSFAIKARPAANEVCGVYMMDEMTMELVVKFNKAHPLYRVEVECSRRVGVPAGQWRNWLLQMITYMSNQNGTILDAFMLWKQNVDKRFDGIDDCCICYSAIHGANYSLPDKRCKTCNNSFHSTCLFKWFSSSQQSTCPLCRNIWMG